MGAIAFVALDAVHAGTSLCTVLMAVSLIRRSRKQPASSTAGSGALISTLNTADRLLWLEDHAAAERDEAGTLPPPARLEEGSRCAASPSTIRGPRSRSCATSSSSCPLARPWRW